MNPIDPHTLRDAAKEIRSLRRKNELLSAKVEMIDLFACVLHTRPAENDRGASPDVAWMLDKAADALSTTPAGEPK